MLKKLLVLASGVLLAAPLLAGNGVVIQTTESSLNEIQRLCKETAAYSQAPTPISGFTCRASKTFWVETGKKSYSFQNQDKVSYKALIKDGAHESSWTEMNMHGECVTAECPVYEQWEKTAFITETFRTCEELLAIQDEQVYCEEQLAPVWSLCEEQTQQAQQFLPFQAPAAAACEYKKLGIQASCNMPEGNGCVDQICQVPSKGSEQQDAPACVKVSAYELGGDIKVTRINRGFRHMRHDVIEIASTPLEGGMLSQLGLKAGDLVESINFHRIRNAKDFLTHIAKAKAEGKARLSVRKNGNEFIEVSTRF